MQPTLLTGLSRNCTGRDRCIDRGQTGLALYKPGATLTPDAAAGSNRHLYQRAGWTTTTKVARAEATRALGHRLQTSMTAGMGRLTYSTDVEIHDRRKGWSCA